MRLASVRLVSGRRALLAMVAALAVAALAAPVVPAPVAAQVVGPSVTVTPSSGVTDGQALAINVKGTPGAVVSAAVARLCRDGVKYATVPIGITSAPPQPDFKLGGPNCPRKPVSTSADLSTSDFQIPNFADAAGETFLFRVGDGVTTWKEDSGTDQTLTCGPDNPCALVIELAVSAGGDDVWQPSVFKITYAKDDPFAGCGGPAAGVLNSGGSDRMIDAWVAWTKAECQKPGRTGAASRASFVGEGDGMKSYTAGDFDFAYSAGGYDADVGFVPPDPSLPSTPRNTVAIPVALNATIFAVAGGQNISGHNVPFKTIKLKADELATMFGGGTAATDPFVAQIRERNPELSEVFSARSAGFGGNPIGAYASAEISSWYATRWLKTRAPDAWKVPDSPTFGADRNKPRGISASLALADPSFNNAIALLSGRPSLRRGLVNVSIEGSGIWALTDLASADAFSATAVQIENARGEFVAPTAESLLAAIPTMKADANGLLIGDPNAVGAEGAVQPYPLTMVEYALVPAEPLVDTSTCVARADSQALLKGWLTHVLGDGQTALPAGFVALPPDLRSSAQGAIDKVGAAEVTGTCAGKVTQPPPAAAAGPGGVTPAAAGGGGGSGGQGGGADGGLGSSEGGPAAALGSSGTGAGSGAGGSAGAPGGGNLTTANLESKSAANEIGIPGFGGSGIVSWLLTVVALLAIVGISSVAALGSAGKLTGLRQRLPFKR